MFQVLREATYKNEQAQLLKQQQKEEDSLTVFPKLLGENGEAKPVICNGDIGVQIWHRGDEKSRLYFWFNTSFIEDGSLQLKLNELDMKKKIVGYWNQTKIKTKN